MKIDLLDTKVGGLNYEFLRAVSYQASEGAELGECIAAVSRVHEGDFDSWIQEWTQLADRVAQEAETALKKGKRAETCNAFLRASNYYRAAEFYASHADPRQNALWIRSRECFHQAASLMSPPVEILEIPFEHAQLPGYFVSGGEGRRFTLIAMGGFDSSAEEIFHWIGLAAAKRGWHCLIFEGPGQRGALHLNSNLILRPDYEIPVSAAVDCAFTRPDIDQDRIALIGYSLGGYLAPRAAAFEPRIKACIANSLVVDLDEAWRASWPAPLRTAPDAVFDTIFATLSKANAHIRWAMDQARWSIGIKHPHEFFRAWKPYTLWGLEQRLKCPLLCLFGEDEIAAVNKKLLEETVRYIDALKCLKDIHLFTRESGAASHCQMGGISRAQTVIFDWLEETFSGNMPSPGEDTLFATRIPTELLTLIEKYHGKEIVRNLQWLDLFHNSRMAGE